MTDATVPNPILAEGWQTHAAQHGHAHANRLDDDGTIRGHIRNLIGQGTHAPLEGWT